MTVIQSKTSDSAVMSLTRMQETQDEQEEAAILILKKLEDRVKTIGYLYGFGEKLNLKFEKREIMEKSRRLQW